MSICCDLQIQHVNMEVVSRLCTLRGLPIVVSKITFGFAFRINTTNETDTHACGVQSTAMCADFIQLSPSWMSPSRVMT